MNKETALISHEFNQVTIQQREMDGYIHATTACKACGKRLDNYWVSQETREFLRELSSFTGIPVNGNSETKDGFPVKPLIDIIRGGIPSLQGTWVHPYVAVNLAQWANPRFAVQVAVWVIDWMTTGQSPIQCERPQPNRTIPAGQMIIKKDEMITMLQQTNQTQAEMISLLKAEINRLKTEPEHRPRVTPEETRRILTMKATGHSPREIADVVGRNPETVRTVLYRECKKQ